MPKEERDRILRLVEEGQVTARQAGELIDALEAEPVRIVEPVRERTIRVCATSTQARSQRVKFVATIPVRVIKTSLRLGAKLFPQLGDNTLEDLLRAVERGATGRLLDVQDLEQGERLEIFVE